MFDTHPYNNVYTECCNTLGRVPKLYKCKNIFEIMVTGNYVIVINHSRGLFAIYKHDSRGLCPRVSVYRYISQTKRGIGQ